MARKFVLALCLAAASAFVAPSSSVRASAPLQNAVLDPFGEIQKTIDIVDDSQLLTKVANAMQMYHHLERDFLIVEGTPGEPRTHEPPRERPCWRSREALIKAPLIRAEAP